MLHVADHCDIGLDAFELEIQHIISLEDLRIKTPARLFAFL
jgi:hypothetical protein